MSDSLKWLRSQEEVYRHIGSSHASGQYKAAADEIERLWDEREGLVYMASSSGCTTRKLPRYAGLRKEIKRLEELLNHAGRITRKRNVEVLEALGETTPTNPEEHYIPPVTLARRARKAEIEIERLQAVMDAADAFLATPPPDMPESHHFGQSTTAGDCRKLNKAYREVAEAKEK